MRLDTSTDPQVGYRPQGTLDAATALVPYDGPFSKRHAAHLLRRAGFGGTADEVSALAALGAPAAVDAVLHPREPEPDFAAFPDAALLYDKHAATPTAQAWWLDRMLRTRRPFAEKLALFWHGHFATSARKVPAALMVTQIDMLRQLGGGDFRALLLAVSHDPAMLVWLDNRYNVKAKPNENYAREVMELFTLGLGNYTEDDVHAAARAFTGWTIDKAHAFVFRAAAHDDGVKTLLGRTGPLTGEDAIGIIVAQPVHKRFMARKLLEFFVYSDPEPELIESLASVYALSGYNVARTMGTVLRSNVFFSPRAYRALPKSPIEYVIGLQRFTGVAAVPPDTMSWLTRMGQEPLQPPSVKGWDGGPAWINTGTLLARFNYVNRLVKTAPPAPKAAVMTGASGASATSAVTGGGTMPAMRAAPAPGASPPPVASAAASAASPAAPQVPVAARYPTLTPETIAARAGGLDARRVAGVIVADALQDDATSAARRTLVDYLDSAGATVPTPLDGENYQDKIRGALALALVLPANQLA